MNDPYTLECMHEMEMNDGIHLIHTYRMKCYSEYDDNLISVNHLHEWTASHKFNYCNLYPQIKIVPS